MSLDPDNQKILDMMKAAGRPPVNELQPDEARKHLVMKPSISAAVAM
jgi:hypothetical protein